MTSYNRSRLFICSCFFSRLFICSCFFSRLFICSCFFESTYCTYLFYVHTVRALLIVPTSLFLMFFISTYCTYLFYVHTVSAPFDRSRLFICSCFLYVPTVLCKNVFSFWELFPATTKKLTFPPLYFLIFFLHLPTVHTFSTYILYVLCWPSCLFTLLMFFVSTYCVLCVFSTSSRGGLPSDAMPIAGRIHPPQRLQCHTPIRHPISPPWGDVSWRVEEEQ